MEKTRLFLKSDSYFKIDEHWTKSGHQKAAIVIKSFLNKYKL